MDFKHCAICNWPLELQRAKYLGDLMDKLMSFLPEPTATELGDQLVFGRVPAECIDDEERVIICDLCTLTVINRALTS
jgi:hypothetical protein